MMMMMKENQRDSNLKRTKSAVAGFEDRNGHEQRNMGSLYVLEKHRNGVFPRASRINEVLSVP